MKTDWYKNAIVYQVYPFSFKDSDNDGWGDIKGILSKPDYIKDLGVTAIWFSPLTGYHMPKSLAFKFIKYGARDHARVPMSWDDSINSGFNEGHKTW